jgi:hypothetical protein
MPDDASIVRAGETLLTGRGEQLSLAGELDEAGLPAEAYARLEERGRFTGERLFSSNPRIYQAIVKLLARDLHYREIADVLGVSINTVCGVAHREGLPIETERERLGKLDMQVARLSAEELVRRLADPVERTKIPADKLAVILGIGTQNGQLLLGGATSRIDHGDTTPPAHDDYWQYVKPALPTGSAPGNPAQIARVPGAIEIEATPMPASDPAPAQEQQNKP